MPLQLTSDPVMTAGLYWTVGTTLAAESAPKGLETTLQGFFTTLVSAGQTLALGVGGVLFDQHGGAELYRGAAIAAAGIELVALTLVVTSPRCSARRRGEPKEAAEVADAAAVLPAGELRSDEVALSTA